MQFSVTEIEQFKTCPRQWFLGSFNGLALEKIVRKPALDLGTCIHEALAGWSENPSLDPVELYLVAKDKAVEAAKLAFLQSNKYSMSEADEDILLANTRLGAAMMYNYKNFWKAPLPPNYTHIAQEQEIVVDIPGSPHRLQGRLDGLIQDQYSRIFAKDIKTYSNRPRPHTLQTSAQFTGYTYILKRAGICPPERVAGVAYDGLWARAMPPKSVDNAPGTIEHLFTRERIVPNAHQLAEYESMLGPVTNLMAEIIERRDENDPRIYPVRAWDGSCSWKCSFDEVCWAWTRGEDWKFLTQGAFKKREKYQTEAQ